MAETLPEKRLEKSAESPHVPKLVKHLDKIVKELGDLSPRAVKPGESDAVHDARVATRRLKAALDLFSPVISEEKTETFEKITRLLRRRLGPVRDRDVMLQRLEGMKSPRHANAATWLSERLKKSHKKALNRAAGDLSTPRVLARLGSWWGVRQEIIACEEAIPSLLAESVRGQLDHFASAATKLAEQNPTTDPHAIRIAGKSLRYTLEMARASGTKLPRKTLSHFKRMQTALGDWHDYVVLVICILSESIDQDLPLRDPQLQVELLNLTSALVRRSRRELTKVAEFWRKDGAELMEAICRGFPLTSNEPAQAAAPQPPTLVQAEAPEKNPEGPRMDTNGHE